jgi:hypothetical protein
MSIELDAAWDGPGWEQMEETERLMWREQETTMPKIDEVFPAAGNHLKAADLGGRAVRVTISEYEIVDFKGRDVNAKPERKIVLSFEGKEKTLVVNKTNARVIAAHFGDELDDWVGGTIVIYPTRVTFAGDMVDAIRVKEPEPAVADLDDEIPF